MALSNRAIAGITAGSLALALLVVYWRYVREVNRLRSQRARQLDRSEEAAEQFFSSLGIGAAPPSRARARAHGAVASPKHKDDQRIPVLVILPDQTLDVAFLERSSGSRARRARAVKPFPVARCKEFAGIPDTLVWSIAILDRQHPLYSNRKLSSSSRISSFLKLAAGRSLDRRGHLQAGSTPDDLSRWWSTRSQDLPYAAPAAARDPFVQSSDHGASLASPATILTQHARQHSSTSQGAVGHHSPASAPLRRSNTADDPLVSDDGRISRSARESSSGLRLSGRLGSLGSFASFRIAPRARGTDSSRGSHRGLSEIVIA